MGVGRGRLPSITERSEWHSPAAFICTSTSPCPGGSSSTSWIARGLDFSYGVVAPIFSSTAALIFIGPSSQQAQRHPEERPGRVSKDGNKLRICGHPSRRSRVSARDLL